MNIVINNIVIIVATNNIAVITTTRAFAKLLCLCCPGRCLSRLWTKWKRRLEEEKKVRLDIHFWTPFGGEVKAIPVAGVCF